MKTQRGQSVVEFAFVVPMFTLFLFGLIYGGTMFLQYFNLSNDARAEARRIAVMTSDKRKVELGDPYPTVTNPKVKTNPERFGSFYNVTQKIWVTTTEPDADGKTELEDVVVRVEFERDNNDLPNVLKAFNWPPKEFAMAYRMQIENE